MGLFCSLAQILYGPLPIAAIQHRNLSVRYGDRCSVTVMSIPLPGKVQLVLWWLSGYPGSIRTQVYVHRTGSIAPVRRPFSSTPLPWWYRVVTGPQPPLGLLCLFLQQIQVFTVKRKVEGATYPKSRRIALIASNLDNKDDAKATLLYWVLAH